MSKEELLKRFDELVAEVGSQNKAAELVGASASAISQIKSGTYGANEQRQLFKLEKYFAVKDAAVGSFKEIEYAPISTSYKIYTTIQRCHIKGGFAIATGDAGVGKTKAIQQYRKDNEVNTIVITANPAAKSAKAVLKLLALRLGVPVSQPTDDMWFSIVSKLHDGMVVIVDEAQLLTFQAIETLRSIADYFDSYDQTLGVALIGNNGIRERIEGKTREIYRQVNNRAWQRPFIQTTDVKQDDIVMLFPMLAPGSSEIKFLHKVAQSVEGVRGAVRLFTNAYENEHYDLAGLAEMAKAMSIDLKGVDLKNV